MDFREIRLSEQVRNCQLSSHCVIPLSIAGTAERTPRIGKVVIYDNNGILGLSQEAMLAAQTSRCAGIGAWISVSLANPQEDVCD